jgi:O-antigen ligase
MRGIGLSLDDPDITTGRSHFWSVALKMFLDHPFIGVGWEAFGVAFTPYDTNNGYFRVDQAHNEYLQVLAEGGILGFACLAAFIYLLFRKSWRTIRRSSGMIREASIGALAGCFGIMVHSVFDFPLRTPSNAFFFLLLSAIAVFPASRAGKS